MTQYLARKPMPSIVFGGMLAATCRAIEPLIKENGPALHCYTPAVHPGG